jgi:hypothetical protein
VELSETSMHTFRQTFDRAFGAGSLQVDIFSEFQQSLPAVLQGFNFTVLAYGQTGAGNLN